MSQIIGHISQVIGPVVDVYFEGTDAELMLPSIHDALEIKKIKWKNINRRSAATHRREHGENRSHGQYRRLAERYESASHRRSYYYAGGRPD